LQFNQRGAWRNAVDFDAADAEQASRVMQYGEDLARITKAHARIVTGDGMQTAIAGWTPDRGWYDFCTGTALP
jgi:hypothetical protein